VNAGGKSSHLVVVAATTLAMIAFAANSVLCRLALDQHKIDAASFSSIRLLSGAAVLVLITAFLRPGEKLSSGGGWLSALLLLSYAISFSFAYLKLGTGTGALILFGAVQITMLSAAIIAGERPAFFEWTGFILGIGGLAYLVLPGLYAPSIAGSMLMIVSGISWGIYSLRGAKTNSPLVETRGNFLRTAPFAICLALIAFPFSMVSKEGVLYAVMSGAIASGLGYVVWYFALGRLLSSQAAIVQLSVPVIAAVGGVLFLSEQVTMRLVIAAIMTLGGISLPILGRARE